MSDNQHHLPYWLAALYLQEMGDLKFKKVLSHFESIKALFEASEEQWKLIGLSEKAISSLKNPNWKTVEKDLAWAEKPHHFLLTWQDEHYPPLLKETIDPPRVLFVQGDPHTLLQKQIAMVGSRHASPQGLQHAEQFSFALAEAGFAITSGLALGVDAASHRGALKANGMTIGVAGTGLNHIYPRVHQKLVEEIIQQRGAVISEFPLQAGPNAWHFPRRNRIIAGMSLGVLVVEAAVKSGSLITARLAVENGRDVFAIPGSIHHPLARGCHALIRQGAILIETASDIINELGLMQAALLDIAQTSKIKDTPEPIVLPEDQLALFNCIDEEVTPLDAIILRSQLTAAEVSSILLLLELNGHIESVPGGYRRA